MEVRNHPIPVGKEPQMIYVTHICRYCIVNSHIKVTIKEKILSWNGKLSCSRRDLYVSSPEASKDGAVEMSTPTSNLALCELFE